MDCSTPGFPIHHQLPELTQTHVHWVAVPSNHLTLCCPLLLPCSIFPSIRICSNEEKSVGQSICVSASPSNEYSGLISFRMYWFDLLAVQGTLKSLLQHPSSKVSILPHFLYSPPPYMTTGKTIALTRRNFVSKVMSLLFNMLSRLVIVLLPRASIF